MTVTQRGRAAALMLVFLLDFSGPSVGTAGSGDAGAGETRRDRRFEGVVLAASQPALESESGETPFNFARLRDLWVRVWLAGAPNPVQLNLRLIDPEGTLIYEASVPYSSDPAITTADVNATGRPVAVFKARSQDGWVALDYALPVSGSVVTRHLSEGTWTLVAEAGKRTFSTSIDVGTVY